MLIVLNHSKYTYELFISVLSSFPVGKHSDLLQLRSLTDGFRVLGVLAKDLIIVTQLYRGADSP